MRRASAWCSVAWVLVAGCGAESDDPSGSGGRSGNGRAGTQQVEQSGRAGCETVTVRSFPTTPDMLIVLDRSASMAPSGNEGRTDRWRGSSEAIIEVTRALESGINFGLMTFPGSQAGGGRGGGLGDFAAQCAPGRIDVELGTQKADEIAQALGRMGPRGFTPTASTLEAALAAIASPVTADQGAVPPKYVLLVTDGDPNCSDDFPSIIASGATVDPKGQAETVTAVERLTKAGVQTYIVGYQTAQTSFAGQLDRMAAAGGTGQTKHRSVASGAELTTAFRDLAGRALSCSYKLDERVEDPTHVLVTVDEKPRRRDSPSDGWTLGPDAQTVTLTGAACDAAQRGAVFHIEVQCTPVVAI